MSNKNKNNYISLILTISFLILTIHSAKIKSTYKLNKFDIDLFHKETNLGDYMNHLKSFTKYKYSTSLLQMETEAESFSDLGLHKSHFSFYVGYIYVGHPPQIVEVVFDSGSGETFLSSKYCIQNKQCAGVEHYYNSTLSRTHKDLNVTIEVTFGKGELHGKFGTDVIALSPNLIMLNQPVGEIVTVRDKTLQAGGISGVVGFGYPLSSAFNHTFFDGLIQSKILDRNVICFYFDKLRGKINFGYIDANQYVGDLNSHKVVDKFYWTLSLNDIKVNEHSLNLCHGDCKVVIDTAASGLIVSPHLYRTFIQSIDVKPDCSNMQTLPDISFQIDIQEYIMKPEYYVLKYLNRNTKRKECALNVIPLTIPRFVNEIKTKNIILLGENFIRNYYTVFDRDTDSVHFGIRKISQ
jgi:hypothetical protein